jgi:predicted ATPase
METVHLPAQIDPLIGRERELAAIRHLLAQSHVRLLTLTGSGGSGKTRLAIQAAVEAAANFPNGAVFVPLEAVRDHQLVAIAFDLCRLPALAP